MKLPERLDAAATRTDSFAKSCWEAVLFREAATELRTLTDQVAEQRRLIQNAQAVLAQATYVVDGKLGTDIQNVCDELYLHLKSSGTTSGDAQ